MNACPICGNPIKTKNAMTCSWTCRERKKFLDKIERIQSKFKHPLKEIIHSTYNSGQTTRDIAQIIGLNRTDTHGIQHIFNHFGIKRRPGGGLKPGGITDSGSEAYRKNKIRMIYNNPSTNPIIRRKMTMGKSKHLLENQSEMTKYVARMLTKYRVNFIQEKVVDIYIIDFAIGNIGLEIDGRGHYGRFQKDRKRDAFLVSQGWKIIRIKGDMRKSSSFKRNLKKLIVSGQIPSRNQP